MTGWKEAFALSKSQVKAATPIGTVEIIGKRISSPIELSVSRSHLTLKAIPGRGEGEANNELVKFPRPSADPRDPLNLPGWHKAAALLVVSLYAFVGNFASSIVAPALQIWPFNFPQDPRSISELSRLIAVSYIQRFTSVRLPLFLWH